MRGCDEADDSEEEEEEQREAGHDGRTWRASGPVEASDGHDVAGAGRSGSHYGSGRSAVGDIEAAAPKMAILGHSEREERRRSDRSEPEEGTVEQLQQQAGRRAVRGLWRCVSQAGSRGVPTAMDEESSAAGLRRRGRWRCSRGIQQGKGRRRRRRGAEAEEAEVDLGCRRGGSQWLRGGLVRELGDSATYGPPPLCSASASATTKKPTHLGSARRRQP